MPNKIQKQEIWTIRNPQTQKPMFVWMLWDPIPDPISPGYWKSFYEDSGEVGSNNLVNLQGMHYSGNINIIARVRGEGWAINSGDKPDSSWPDYPVLLGDEWFYSEINAIAVGKRMADWFDYQTLDRQYAHEWIGGKPYAGGIFPHEWGKQKFGKTLFDEPEDLVPDRLTTSDFSGFTDAQQIVDYRRANVKYVSGFCANAIRKSTTNQQVRHSNGNTYLVLGLSNWITKVAETMKAELDSRNLCYPAYLSLDLEGFSPDMFGFVGTDEEPARTATATQVTKLFRSSHIRSIQLDPRYSTETVWEEWNGVTWLPRTWRDAYVAAGSPQHTPTSYMTGSFQNQDFVRRMSPFIQKMMDYALWKTIYEPLKRVFPGIKCGNYYCYTTPNPQYYDSHPNNSWLRTPVVQLGQRYTKLRADYQSPVCYGPNMLNTVFKYDPAWYRTTPVDNTRIDLGGHRYGTNDTDIYKNFLKGMINSVNPSQSTAIQVAPWFEFPGRRVGSEIGDERPQRLYTSTKEDILDILKYSHDRGVVLFHFFNNFMQVSPEHPILGPAAWPINQQIDAITMFYDFISYARDKASKIKLPTAVAGGPG